MSGQAAAWADYWRDAAGTGGGCASGAPGITAACAALWKDFAAALPRRASVLDLATGNGAVLGYLHGARRDATLFGVDSAPDLGREGPGGSTLIAGAAMEALPFEASRFDAVTSQFGFEYGDTAAIAGEIARVLAAGGVLRLLIHHADSPVVAQGRTRRDQLRWAVAPGTPLEQAGNYAAARVISALPIPPALRAAPSEAARRFPGQSAAAEIMMGMVQILELGGARAPALLGHLRSKVAGELARLDALLDAARDRDGIEAVRRDLDEAGLTTSSPTVVREGTAGPIFAWQIEGRCP